MRAATTRSTWRRRSPNCSTIRVGAPTWAPSAAAGSRTSSNGATRRRSSSPRTRRCGAQPAARHARASFLRFEMRPRGAAPLAGGLDDPFDPLTITPGGFAQAKSDGNVTAGSLAGVRRFGSQAASAADEAVRHTARTRRGQLDPERQGAATSRIRHGHQLRCMEAAGDAEQFALEGARIPRAVGHLGRGALLHCLFTPALLALPVDYGARGLEHGRAVAFADHPGLPAACRL